MWFLRRLQRIPWTARVTNEEVLRRAGVERGLIRSIRRRQLQFLGHPESWRIGKRLFAGED